MRKYLQPDRFWGWRGHPQPQPQPSCLRPWPTDRRRPSDGGASADRPHLRWPRRRSHPKGGKDHRGKRPARRHPIAPLPFDRTPQPPACHGRGRDPLSTGSEGMRVPEEGCTGGTGDAWHQAPTVKLRPGPEEPEVMRGNAVQVAAGALASRHAALRRSAGAGRVGSYGARKCTAPRGRLIRLWTRREPPCHGALDGQTALSPP